MLLRFADGTPFAQGATPYAYRAATEAETSPRIIITVMIGEMQTTAFVDTGGVYLLCPPEIAHRAQLDRTMAIPTAPLRWGRGTVRGSLQRIPVTLVAAEGQSLTIEATAFVPEPGYTWGDDMPCILGLQGCLENLRFAVDPNDDTFYFGALGELPPD
jgi:hypothetical protein